MRRQRWGNSHAMALRRKDQPLMRFLASFKKPTRRLFTSTALSQKVFFYAYSAIVDGFVIVSFFLEKCYIPQYYRWLTCYVVPDYANVLVQLVAIFGVINRAPATTPAHKIFCYSTVAHILTPSVNLAFRPNSGFKTNFRDPAVFGLGSGFKMRPFCNSVWVCMQ